MFDRVLSKLRTIKALFSFLWAQKAWWLLPIVILTIVLGTLIALSNTAGIATFVYPAL